MDEVVEPAHTRRRVASILATARPPPHSVSAGTATSPSDLKETRCRRDSEPISSSVPEVHDLPRYSSPVVVGGVAGRRRAPDASRCDVYVASLDALEPRHDALISEAEANRRAHYRLDGDRSRFTLGTVLLRAVVGHHLRVPAASVVIDRTCDQCGAQHGRARAPGTGIEASISHSGDVVAVAVTAAGPVGMDVEIVAPCQYGALTPTVCTSSEEMFVRKPSDFFAYWTRKEAVLKAAGVGLRTAMTDVVVTPPEAEPALLALGGAPPPPCRMADVCAREGYAGAVAVLTADPVAFTVVEAARTLAAT